MKLFVPLLDNGNGSVMASFMMDHAEAFRGREVEMVRASDSHANRGMNKIANAFLDSDCDVWINIDADIRFRRQDIDCLLEHELPLVYGIYPKKEDAASPCLCTFADMPQPDAKTGLVEVRRCGRGFMLVRREVLEAMKEDNGGPALRYHNHEKIEWDFFPSGCVTGAFSALEKRPQINTDETQTEKFPESEICESASGGLCSSVASSNLDADGYPLREWISEDWYFSERDFEFRELPYNTDETQNSPICENLCSSVASSNLDADGYPLREWISEDWYFCERARSLGFPTMVDTRVALGHVGQKEYRFGPDQVTRMDSQIESWREIHGWFDYVDLYREIAAKIGAEPQINTDETQTEKFPESEICESASGGLCSSVAFPVFVEVGCWMGRSIAAFAQFVQDLGKTVELHVVDTFQGAPANATQQAMLEAHGGNIEKIFRANMAALGFQIEDFKLPILENARDSAPNIPNLKSEIGNLQLITVHAKPSVEAAEDFADGSIDAIFIDGDHREEAVRADILFWREKVKPGGILAGHDIDQPGVAAAVKDAFADFEVKGRCWVVKKL